MAVRFDPAARKAIDHALIEVERLGHASLDTAHLLLGLLHARGTPVAEALATLGINADALRATASAALRGAAGPVEGERIVDVAGATEQILERAAELSAARGARAVADVDILAAAAEHAETRAGAILKQAHVTAEQLRAVTPKVVPTTSTTTPTSTPAYGAPRVPGAAEARAMFLSSSGIGYDSHRFAPGGPLILGGVSIPADVHLAGHSDGDAVAHAITDAILGAGACGDIGEMFPDTAAENRGRSSIEMLRLAVERVRQAGWRVAHVDCTVILEQPKLAPHRDAMRRVLAGALGVAPAQVSVKGKTNEGMGWIGRGEGAACIAVATLAAGERPR